MSPQRSRCRRAALIRPSTTEHPLYDSVVEACRTVFDPEIPVNIFDLGLVYTIEIGDENEVDITMTLTAPGCPVAGEMPGWVADAVERRAGRQDGRRPHDLRPALGHGNDVRRGTAGTGLHVGRAAGA
jgi:metal-sulfur cluster biosynthetic enzyme